MKLQRSLAPLSLLYAAGLSAKNLAYTRGWLRPQTLRWPVLSIGNLSLGGAGKTPVVLALAELLAAHDLPAPDAGTVSAGRRPLSILSRGYGRRHPRSTRRVDTHGSAAQYGDEPLLLARLTGLPVYVGASRYQAGLLAERQAAQGSGSMAGIHLLHLLDDGFQHRQLARTVDIVVIHPADITERLLPAGRLREPLSALRRAHIVVLRDNDTTTLPRLGQLGFTAKVWRVRRTLAVPALAGPSFAFSGIAHPAEFFQALRAAGVTLAGTLAFRDHHPFRLADLARIRAQSAGAQTLLTTEKDWVRLTPQQRAELAAHRSFHPVPLRAELGNPDQCRADLAQLLAAHPASAPMRK